MSRRRVAPVVALAILLALAAIAAYLILTGIKELR